MKIIPILKKLEDNYIRLSKKRFKFKEMQRGDIISLIYYDIDKENIKNLNFVGFCKRFRSKGFNTKIAARLYSRRIYVEQEFFLYGKTLLDAGLVKKRNKFSSKKSKLL